MDKRELPLGLGMALAQNELTMQCFESMSETEKAAFVAKTHAVNSKREMQRLVNSLTD